MYAGYPVFIITYFDKDNNRYNYTTSSSMYTLGKMVVLGLGDNNAKKCILEMKDFTVSFLNSEFVKDFEVGSKSGKIVDKFKESNLILENFEGLNYILQSELVYDLTVIENLESKEFPEYSNIVCKLNRILAKDILVDNGSLNTYKYSPTIFIGTDQGRFFKDIKN